MFLLNSVQSCVGVGETIQCAVAAFNNLDSEKLLDFTAADLKCFVFKFCIVSQEVW